MTDISPLPHIARMKPYVPGGKLSVSDQRPVMLASNENALGPSQKAVDAMVAVAGGVNLYPDPDYLELRTEIAKAVGVSEVSRIITGVGSGEIIHLLTQCYAGPGDEVLFTEHGFSLYPVAAGAHGADAVSVPETDLTAGVNAILGAVSDRTKLLFLANPNNPTGTMLSIEDLESIQDALPPHVLFVIDGAYAEYVGPDYEVAIRDLVDRTNNTVMVRTFSKIHALAAMRLGWAYVREAVAENFNRVRGPFNVSAFAAAGGAASITDTDFLEMSRAHNNEWRSRVTEALNAMGLTTPESHANFVLPEFGSETRAAEAYAFLKARNILVRAVGGYGLPTRLRISVGSAEDNESLLAALKDFTASR